jgi:hypothetical protein
LQAEIKKSAEAGKLKTVLLLIGNRINEFGIDGRICIYISRRSCVTSSERDFQQRIGRRVMELRRQLLQTTMLTGLVGGLFLTNFNARAGDLVVPAAPYANYAPSPYAGYAPYPAVDGANAKIDGLGGSLGQRSLYATEVSFSVPVGRQYGLQIDGIGGSWGDRSVGDVAGHLFWRDPNVGLLGVYTSHTWWDQFGGIYVGNVAGEGEYYWGPLTLQGIIGVEYGNSQTAAIATAAGTTFQTFDIKTRYFDQINLKYYLSNNWDAYVGHRYLGGQNMLALGTEFALPVGGGSGVMASAFVEGRLGDNNSQGIWGGLKFYFGQHDKPLIARQRQDDPNNWGLGSLFSINNSFKQTSVPTTGGGGSSGSGSGSGSGSCSGSACG